MWLLHEENSDLLLFEDDGDYPFTTCLAKRSFAKMEAANLEETYEGIQPATFDFFTS